MPAWTREALRKAASTVEQIHGRRRARVDNIDFRLGFICARRSQRLAQQQELSGWNRILTQKHKLFVHPETSMRTTCDAQGRTVLVLGDIFVAHGDVDLDNHLLRIASGEREGLDDLSGRFALFVFDEDQGTVLHDPLGSQSVFYSVGPDAIVASHAALLAQQTDVSVSKRLQSYMQTEGYRRRTTRFLPGDLSLYSGIVHLIPNNELDMRSGATTRYWPIRPVAAATLEELHAVWSEYFSRYAMFLKTRFTPVIGLTGGLDSRAVIAALRAFGVEARFVTWNMGEDEAARIPGLAQHVGGRHDWLSLTKEAVDPAYAAVRTAARLATGFTRGTPVLPALMAALAGPRDAFVKGLGGEVMRGPFSAAEKPWLPTEPVDMMYRLYAGRSPQGDDPLYETTTAEAFAAYLQRANYGAELFDCDVGDLFYWEQRMGTWTSVQHAEMSVAMQSHSAMNSRRLFATSWGLPHEQRFSSELLLELMRRFDPKIARM